MSSSSHTTSRSFPMRAVYDCAADQLTVVVDATPATVDDITVTVSSKQIQLRIDHGETAFEQTITPPVTPYVFTDDRNAVYNNGVLTISVGTTRRSER
ncbi:hypothetical protein GS429_21335 [Natronorubrum sp. JWXQ-INN-674]|uniref:Hsp20/alpha crystallin family protein n=1 Tax=Natronorubrum halalkaliphilum TaxID=2691917 RepID=A0A6B0VSG2_9EURY|nr:hypothetical protein [Natronorubrum halalkaliphilum]MXV64570.1 hypothetical protein [Natronorubrum halalkaliphilum]